MQEVIWRKQGKLYVIASRQGFLDYTKVQAVKSRSRQLGPEQVKKLSRAQETCRGDTGPGSGSCQSCI